jgi:hypothetical protein
MFGTTTPSGGAPANATRMKTEMKPKASTLRLADARLAMLRLLMLPDDYADLTESDLEFLRSDIVRELVSGRWQIIWKTSNYGKQIEI